MLHLLELAEQSISALHYHPFMKNYNCKTNITPLSTSLSDLKPIPTFTNTKKLQKGNKFIPLIRRSRINFRLKEWKWQERKAKQRQQNIVVVWPITRIFQRENHPIWEIATKLQRTPISVTNILTFYLQKEILWPQPEIELHSKIR